MVVFLEDIGFSPSMLIEAGFPEGNVYIIHSVTIIVKLIEQ